MHKGNVARIERRGITGELTPVGVCAQAIFGHRTLRLYLLAPQFQRMLLVFCQVEQLLAGRFLVLVAGNENRGIGVRSQAGRVPGARPTGEHSTTGENTGRGAGQDTFAFLFITYKGNVWPGEREISLARSEEHTSELQSPDHLVCRLLLEKKKHTIT